MARRNVKVGAIKDVSGEINIAGGDISVHKGYTAEQVSVLLTQITSTFQPKPFDGRCPYKGLDVFEEEDANLFFGRERLVLDLVGRVQGSRTVFITGPSGSGKSSLVRAGLIHALKEDALKDLRSERWLYGTIKPGREPITELARAVSGLAGTLGAGEDIRTKGMKDATILAEWCEIALKEGREKRVVLFVDQFEEVFTQINDETERQAFLNLLTHAATVANGRVIVLFAMRSDFLSNCATYPRLNALLNQEFIQIGAMQPNELVNAIAQPALRVGLRIEPDLIAQIINDMQGEPGALPLMQFALKDLFDSQQEKGGMVALTLDDYLRRGGIHKSLERHADNAFTRLSASEQELARSVFGGLIEVGRGTQDTRRTALFEELVPASTQAAEVEAIIAKLADARLITTDEQAGKDTVTISHEKLIDAWPWLKKLVNENREAIALQNEIANDAKEWGDHRRDPSYLYTGARLVNAREQLASKKLVLSGLAQEFVQASHGRQRRGQMLAWAGVAAIMVLLAVAVIVFSSQSQQNQQLFEQAEVRALAAESVAWRERNLPLALLLGIEVFKKEDNVQTRGVLLDNVQFNPQLVQFLRGHTDSVNSMAFSPDGNIMASGSADNTILLWDVSTQKILGEPLAGHSEEVKSISFSADGKILASGSADNTIIFWDVHTQKMIGQPLKGHAGAVYSVAFSPSGEMLASGSADHSIILWDVNTHEPIGQPLMAHSGDVYTVAFSADGQMLASGSADNTIILWDVASQEASGPPLSGHRDGVLSVAFSPAENILASGSADHDVILWDVSTRAIIDQPLKRHSHRVISVAFSPDGKILASGGYDDIVILWDVATHRRIGQVLKGHLGEVLSIAFSPDGSTFASGSADKTVIVWELATDKRIDHVILGHSGFINSVAFHPDGHTLASGSRSGEVMLWDTVTRELIGQPLSGHTATVRSVAFSPNGQILASGSEDGGIILWDVHTHEPVGEPLVGQSGAVYSVAFSPDGNLLASGTADGTILLWDMTTHASTGQWKRQTGRINSVAFSPDGHRLASGSDDGTVLLSDLDSGEPTGEPLAAHSGRVLTVMFSPDGGTLASGGDDNTILLWDLTRSTPGRQVFVLGSNVVASLAFSPDGGTLASGIYDRTIVLWDVKTRQSIGQPLQAHTGAVYAVSFSPDGRMLASGSFDNNVILWDMDPHSWLAKACQRAGRNFTRQEWEQYFPNEEYDKTCEQWPLEPEPTRQPGPARPGE